MVWLYQKSKFFYLVNYYKSSIKMVRPKSLGSFICWSLACITHGLKQRVQGVMFYPVTHPTFRVEGVLVISTLSGLAIEAGSTSRKSMYLLPGREVEP